MKMTRLLSATLFLAAVIFTGCDSKTSERRIAELQDKLAEVEKGGTATTTATTPATTTEAAAETTDPNVKPDGPLPTFQWVGGEEHDFGNITEGEVVEHTFIFKNTGEAPLIIEKAQASCGCTVPSWTKEPVAPGATGEIQVKFDSKGKPNVQNKTVTITANTYPKISRLRIKTFVNPKTSVDAADGPVRN
jgi:hypothetical protein